MPASDDPRFNAGSFACPHCGANCQQNWATAYAKDDRTEDSFDPYLSISTCFVCNGEAVWLRDRWTRKAFAPEGQLVHPTAERHGPTRSTDMPDNVAHLYDEASTVVALSPRSASALLRLALEVLLEGLYPAAGKLNDMIGAAVADGLPQQVTRTMDVMRFSGNQSAHKFHHDDTMETATTLFGLLNVIVDRLITQPKQLDDLYDGLPESFKAQVERRDTPSA